MDVRKVQDVRKNVEHQYIAEDSKTRMKAKYMCRLMIQDLEEASLTD